MLHGEARIYEGMLNLCQSYRGDYVCPLHEIVVTGDNGTGSSAQVPIVRHAWTLAAMSYCARHLMSSLSEALALVALTQYREAPG
jgi:hypothetical protein